MVAGLAFLSKKSWHTKNIANQERVWVAEQRKEQEEAKARELAKQIQQEREQDELDKIAGKKTTRIDRGVDWMYHGHQKNSEIAQADAAKKNEDYLLGKAYVPEGGPVGDLDAGANANEGVNAILEAKKPPAVEEAAAVHREPSVAERNEAFRHRHEDPMFAVAMQAKHQQDDFRKKKELYERVVGHKESDKEDSEDDDDRHHRRARKREKKHKKSKKKHRKRRHYSSEEEDSTDNEARRRHHKKRRHRRSGSSDDDSYQERHREYRRRRDYSDDDYHAGRRYRDDRDYGRRAGSSGDEEDYGSYERSHRQKVARRPSPSPDYDGKRNDRPPSTYARHRHDNTGPSAKQDRHEKKAGYGLQGSATFKGASSGDLGPDRELLTKKRREREEQKERNFGRGPRRNMTEEERQAALREMEESARKYHHHRGRQPERQEESARDPQASAAFLQSVARKAHGVSDGSFDLKERISQNRRTNQRLHDDFM